LIQKLSLKSYEGGYKIAIIWQAEMLNIAAGNALLKVLEEPPEQTLFLLVASSSDKLLTTIISRTQRIAVRSFTSDEIVSYLTQKQDIGLERAKQVAYLADGNLNHALEIAHKADDDQHSWFATWMRMCYALNILKLVPMADEFDAHGKEYQKSMLEYGLSIFREIFLYCNGGETLIRLEGDELVFVQKFSNVLNISNLEAITNLLGESHYHIERNGRAKMIFLDISLAIARLMR
jgi:DNA polymerase-3 subunit delta'